MCYKHESQQPAPQGKACIFPSSYFQRQADRQQCVHCHDKLAPGEVKSALGVCTVFVLRKTYEWMTHPKQQQ
uniref:Uncharacterized protein n=1 Tax=Amphimedon queenslandica TaxID=400682 RepID=A0A1X7UPF5_AMPQE